MIEREIPKEILDFDEKIAFGLTIRQILSVFIAAVTCIPLYIFGRNILGEELTSWIVIFIAAPAILIGFFKYQGIPFERIILRIFNQLFILPSKRKFKIKNFWIELGKENKKEADPEKKGIRIRKKIQRKILIKLQTVMMRRRREIMMRE